jgi:hypothetical protein
VTALAIAKNCFPLAQNAWEKAFRFGDFKMQTLISIRTELIRLGWTETHDRIIAFLARAGVTCIQALPEEGMQVLLGNLKRVVADPPMPADDLSEKLALLSVHCDRLGLSLNGMWLRIWLNSQGIATLRSASKEQLDELCHQLAECKPEAYTIPINREIRGLRAAMAEIVDILQIVQPNNPRVAALKQNYLSQK